MSTASTSSADSSLTAAAPTLRQTAPKAWLQSLALWASSLGRPLRPSLTASTGTLWKH
ncbi:hypothetical protein ABHI18_011574 [Aspergillus niger]